MRSKIIRLVKPYKFEEQIRVYKKKKGWSYVKPTLGSICAADMRYYTGKRRPEALKQKLPMALLHEGIGRIVESETLKKDTRVVIVPNIPGYIHSPEKFPSPEKCCRACRHGEIGENHCENIHFLSSGYDGLTQSIIQHPDPCLIQIPDDVPDEIAVLSELSTVAYTGAKKLKLLDKNEKIAVFGDGPVGYIVAVVLSFTKTIKRHNLYVVGTDDEKLKKFGDFAHTINIRKRAIPSNLRFGNLFECVGGIYSEEAINTIIEVAEPGAWIYLLGVSELFVPVNTRDILEKGLRLIGISRSSRFEYPIILEYMREPEMQRLLKRVIINRFFRIRSAKELTEAFDFAAAHRVWGKIYVRLEIS